MGFGAKLYVEEEMCKFKMIFLKNLEGYTLFPKEKEVEQDREPEEGFTLFTVKTFVLQKFLFPYFFNFFFLSNKKLTLSCYRVFLTY